MQVITPGAVARHTGSKYLGVLVAAKRARNMNEFTRGQIFEEDVEIARPNREKFTTTALREVASGDLDFHVVERQRPEQL